MLVVLTEWDDYRWLDAGQGRRGDAGPRRRRRPQPARPQRVAPGRLRVPGHRPLAVARIVVTGGAGFLGSHLCRALLDRGDRVVAVDNLVTGVGRQHRGAVRPPRLHVRRARRQPVRVGARRRSTRSCTSPARRRRSTSSASRSRSSRSAASARTTASAWPRPRAPRFFLASTSEVYGDPQVHPQPETYWGHVNPIGPRGVYDEAKRFAEALTMAYHRHHGLDVRIVRIFNTYGTSDAGRRRAVGVQLPRPGAARRADHGVRRRQPDAVVLLRRRRGARLPRPARRPTHRADQHRQPQRVHDPRARRARRRGHRLVVGRSSSSRCPSTTRRSASPTSRWPARCSAGSRRSRCARASSARPSTSVERSAT